MSFLSAPPTQPKQPFLRKLLKSRNCLFPFCTHLSCHRAETSEEVISTGRRRKRLLNFFIVLNFHRQNFSVYCSIGKFFFFVIFPLSRHCSLISVEFQEETKSYLLKDFSLSVALGLVLYINFEKLNNSS